MDFWDERASAPASRGSTTSWPTHWRFRRFWNTTEIPGAEATLGGWLRLQADAYWAARQVATERGAAGARQLLKLARKNGGALSREDLRRRFPELESWLAGL